MTKTCACDENFNTCVLKFRQALTENVTVIAYVEFHNVININVIFDLA